ncbi:carboxypeptidase-like regulatory domain-containing protein [Vulgatibacter incomptus]|nr:carboxypeptidase-like regulatory domain-containing protein [Vulgatibacter incomptus]
MVCALAALSACGSSGSVHGGSGGSGGSGATSGAGGSGGTDGTGGRGGTGGIGGDDAGGSGGTVQHGIDVEGTIVDKTFSPVAGVKVALNGDLTRFVTTGPDGIFRFSGVDTPYDLSVVSEERPRLLACSRFVASRARIQSFPCTSSSLRIERSRSDWQ